MKMLVCPISEKKQYLMKVKREKDCSHIVFDLLFRLTFSQLKIDNLE